MHAQFTQKKYKTWFNTISTQQFQLWAHVGLAHPYEMFTLGSRFWEVDLLAH